MENKYFTDFILADEDTMKSLTYDSAKKILDIAQELYNEDFINGNEIDYEGHYAYIYHPKSETKLEGVDYGIMIRER